jgi:hypothetical protein
MAMLLSWVWRSNFVLSMGATIVCATPPIKPPAIKSREKFFHIWWEKLVAGCETIPTSGHGPFFSSPWSCNGHVATEEEEDDDVAECEFDFRSWEAVMLLLLVPAVGKVGFLHPATIKLRFLMDPYNNQIAGFT